MIDVISTIIYHMTWRQINFWEGIAYATFLLCVFGIGILILGGTQEKKK